MLRAPSWPLFTGFFVSGFPALIYQLVWQRALFSIYGVNVEAITVVVAAFMLGLGIGSFLGGALSRSRAVPPILLFALLEFGIGLFGLGSLGLFHFVGSRTLGASTLGTGLVTFALVLVPTALMGATLPLLVTHLVKLEGNVGRSLGALYFVNTLGAAVACWFSALLLFPRLGMQGSVNFAAALNFFVSGTALWLWRRTKPSVQGDPTAVQAKGGGAPAPSLSLPLALLLSGAAGFISLSYEIVWARVFGFAARGSAYGFPFVLGAYLLGIAIGSSLVGRYCKRHDRDQERLSRALALLLIGANLFAFLLAPLAGWVSVVSIYGAAFPLLTVAATGLGAVFPLVGHLAVSPDERVGARVSYLYLANIVGSTAGSLLTGFVFTNLLSLERLALLTAGSGLALGGAVLVRSRRRDEKVLLRSATILVVTLAVLLVGTRGYARIYDRLIFNPTHVKRDPFTTIVEDRHGVIAITESGALYGGGVYDGVFNVDLVNDRNLLIRPFALGAFHPHPRKMLVIGLASGSWAQVLAHHPDAQHLTIVEINPAYVSLVRAHANVASVLDNPKVEIVIDDARRWLLAHPQQRFDAVVLNMTFHWRAQATNLLSEEFLRLLRVHLDPGGVVMINGTWSDEFYRTAATVYPFAFRFVNTAVMSDGPIVPDRARWEQQLRTYAIDGKPVLRLNEPKHSARLAEILKALDTTGPPQAIALETRSQILERTRGLPTITDDNMRPEWLKIR